MGKSWNIQNKLGLVVKEGNFRFPFFKDEIIGFFKMKIDCIF